MIYKFQQGGTAQQQQQDPRQVVMIIALKAQEGDELSINIMQILQLLAPAYMELIQQQLQQPAMAKCGAKLKRKEDGGVVEDKCGAKMKKKEIGGAMKPCNCKKRLARLGGKLVNIDCEGNIIK